MPNEFQKYQELNINGCVVKQRNLTDFKSSFEDEALLPFLEEWFSDDDYVELKTSGSTGEPKVIRVKKNAMVASAKKTIGFFGLKPGMTALLALPVSFVAGKLMVVRAMVAQMQLISVKPSVNPLVGLSVTIDFAAFTPMQMAGIIENCPEQTNLLRKVIVGGGRVDERLNIKMQMMPFDAWETYGMTETLTHVALRKINGTGAQKSFLPLSGVSIAIDEHGCLTIDYPEISHGTIKTNDVVELLTDGSFQIIGRADNIINSGGVKISPELVEERISFLIEKPFVISSIPHSVYGERVVLVIEGEFFEYGNLEEKTGALLSRYEKPAKIFFLDTFPRTDSGKIKRFQIKEILRGLT
ncbi:AMP-binding protein [Alkalitalea saponilacus]|uniref:O-succinylbenzoic acid--CoA ligase n=1 Tax=Alkalitalea saponilacus TaxID=889453 RepID=A0A1T5HS21_9BACT|nr:AMP-binding protein [Alkalitalea saponilacus]ASB50013.1 o-succinylbenzoate--CoA ligase [Alkalitalea saponilacus]SKC23475.1 O-succinylbenzoic acid--CoA ligase [Alkalitalea saponilacus]